MIKKLFFLCYLYDKKNICNDFIFSKFKKELKIIPSVFGNFIEKLMNYAEISQEKKVQFLHSIFIIKKVGGKIITEKF